MTIAIDPMRTLIASLFLAATASAQFPPVPNLGWNQVGNRIMGSVIVQQPGHTMAGAIMVLEHGVSSYSVPADTASVGPVGHATEWGLRIGGRLGLIASCSKVGTPNSGWSMFAWSFGPQPLSPVITMPNANANWGLVGIDLSNCVITLPTWATFNAPPYADSYFLEIVVPNDMALAGYAIKAMSFRRTWGQWWLSATRRIIVTL